MIIRFLIIGYCILFIAILANLIADYLNLCTWYKLFQEIISSNFTDAISSQNIFSIIWLFILYPIILASAYVLGEKISHFLIQ